MAPYQDTVAFIDKIATPPPPGTPHSVALPGSEREGRSAVYRHVYFKDGLLSTYDPAIQTFHDLFEDALTRRATAKCLGTRPWNPATKTWDTKYEWITYAEVAERRKNFGAGIVELHKQIGVTADKYSVGLWTPNRAEWQIAGPISIPCDVRGPLSDVNLNLAITSQSLFTVSLYETLGPDATEYIINHAELVCIICTIPHIPVLLKLAPRCPSLKLIICVDPMDAGEPAGHSKLAVLNNIAAQQGIQVHSMADIEELGVKSGRSMRPPQREDVITINYTSGTTGVPKGAILTHGNAVAAIAASRASKTITHRDTGISYLPLAHIYGRMADQVVLAEGGCVGYFHGDIAALVDDMKILKPTGFMSVPRLFNRFNSALQAATVEAPGFKGSLSRHVVNSKKASMRLPNGKATNKHPLFDRIWTPKVLAALGLQRAHAMVSGSAPIDPDVHEFLRAAFGNHFIQGYGLTETYAVASFQLRGDFSIGNVGALAPGIEACLESLPEMEYTVNDKPNPRGELLVRGPVVFQKYYKNDEETSKVVEADGWFHTGDIAEIDSMGRIKIVDRKKNVLKLAQGEYISPERIENVYLGSTNLIATAYVHGDSTQSNLVAIFGIDPIAFAPFASGILKEKLSPENPTALKAAANDTRVKKVMLKKLDNIAKEHKFNSYERVRNCYMDIDPFTIDNDLLTPTLKLKRPQAAKAFRAEIDRMYQELSSEASGNGKAKL
ncbi:Long chain acyl-CoA synthetase 7 [Zalerion maritima]|uniref:Long chain acyl-CoA synthetase 7 n=1 Tax=Zalerion maritima TaxID=339359 RepID=A0AAD5WWR1_9PEZI|nr:Long chain acyl-CoA synthetase 7 [Zalerion maritima]